MREAASISAAAFTPAILMLVSERFKALAEPARLQILKALQDGEHTVNELVEATGLGQANVSKHLQLLHALDFVTRRREGLHVYYALTDDRVFTLCDIVCGRLDRENAARQALLIR